MKNAFILVAIIFFVLAAFTFPKTATPEAVKASKTVKGGIKFNKMGLEKAMEQAKASGKMIFVDVYTTWCGPCKEMSRTTFQSDELGKLFNKKFVNLKMDAEKDDDGKNIAKTFGVSAYPTLLFLNAEGKLVKKLVGKQSEEKLLSIANGL